MDEWKNGYKGGVTEKSVYLLCALFSVIAMIPAEDIDTCLTLAMRNSNVEQQIQLKAQIRVEPYWNYIDSYVKIVI